MSQCHEDNVTELKSRFERLSQQLVDVRAKADKHKVSIRGLLLWTVQSLCACVCQCKLNSL